MRSLIVIMCVLLAASSAQAEELRLADFLQVGGQVRADQLIPIDNALVIAFSLTDRLDLRTSSGPDGRFALPPLPTGVYRIIAAKRGFLPAVATIIPTSKAQSVVLELESRDDASQERRRDAWAIRHSLPKDVLREIELLLGEDRVEPDASPSARVAGNVESVAGYSGDTDRRDLESAAVAFASAVGSWDVSFQGSRHLVRQASASEETAEAADVSIELRSSPSNVYRISSTRAFWTQPSADAEEAGVETHAITWSGGGGSVHVRYRSQENVFPVEVPRDSLEVYGDALLYDGRRSNLAVSVSLRQDVLPADTVGDSVISRYADVGTTGRHVTGDRLAIEYGVMTRVGERALQLMPNTSARLQIGKATSLQVSGAYKFDAGAPPAMDGSGISYLGYLPILDTRYRYSIAVTKELAKSGEASVLLRSSAADALTFLLFDDRFDEFWDGLYLRRGDVLTDGRLLVRAGLGPSFDFSIVGSGGWVQRSGWADDPGSYVSGEVRTHYKPTGTTVDLSYRLLEQQDLLDEGLLREIERLSVVLGQSLHLPVDLTLLLGFSVANEETVSQASAEPREPHTRLVGGLSFSF